ncbi:MAG: MFS transporter [Acidobacteriaceae bacterium]
MSQRGDRLTTAIVAHAMVRIASSASGVLIGIFLADQAVHRPGITAGLLGALGAVSFAAELIFSIPLGVLSDAVSPRGLMTGGAVLGALAIQLFPLSGKVPVFFLSRALEGIAVAAITPPLLAWLADATAGDRTLRARVMSFFELSLLAGLALGGLVGSECWLHFRGGAFGLVAGGYVACAGLLFFGAKGTQSHGRRSAFDGLRGALRDRSVRSLAPIWLCVNAIVGLWLGPTLPFLLTHHPQGSQYLDGIFAARPTMVGWLLLGYSGVFATGVTLWSFVLPRISLRSAMRVALIAMLPVCGGLFLINHSSGMAPELRWLLTAVTALLVMIESGFTPAALAWLAASLGRGSGKGAAMGIYSVLLSLGAIGGSLLAGALGKRLQVDGLLLGTIAMGLCGLILLHGLSSAPIATNKENYEHA